MDVGNDATSGDGGLYEGVEFLVSANGELQVTRSDTLHFEIFTGIASELENFGGEVFEDGRGVNRRGGPDSLVGVNATLEESMNSSDGELQGEVTQSYDNDTYLKAGALGSRLRSFLGRWSFASFAAY